MHPEYAVWAINVNFAERKYAVEKKHISSNKNAKWQARLEEARRRYAHLGPPVREASGQAPFHKLGFAEMAKEVLSEDESVATQMYRIQSMVLHGDAYGAAFSTHIDENVGWISVVNSSQWLLGFCDAVANKMLQAKDLADECERLQIKGNELSKKYADIVEAVI